MDDHRAALLVWIDMEMTGLDPETCHVLEIATILTDAALDVIAEGPQLIIHQPDEVLAGMNAWCVDHHGRSGLTAAARASTTSLADAEVETLEFLQRHTRAGGSPLCGNSVDLDHRFLERHMPRVHAHLRAQIIDVTTIKELARRWYPDDSPPRKQDNHRALDDILESIAELRFYRERLFRPARGGLPC